jgi:XTP/dITP diphosphohydrolase
MISLVVATRNAHKVAEIQSILGNGFACVPMSSFPDAPKLVEDGDTFAANATRKARQLADWLESSGSEAGQGRGPHAGPAGLWVLADDSGLEVDALNGAPGVQSARFAAGELGASGNAPDAANNAKLLRLLRDVPWEKRTARFRCVLALMGINPPSAIRNAQLFEGICEGRIGFAPKGQGGFGYDPLFVPDGYDVSFAELGEDVKNRLSHRFKALLRLRQWLASSGGIEQSFATDQRMR